MKVDFTPQIPTPIKKSGIDIRVTNTPGKGGKLIGTLTVTNTRLVWAPTGVSVNTKSLSWEKFIKYMEDM